MEILLNLGGFTKVITVSNEFTLGRSFIHAIRTNAKNVLHEGDVVSSTAGEMTMAEFEFIGLYDSSKRPIFECSKLK